MNNRLPGFPKVVGGVTVDNPVWLAPLAGITFASLRRFHKDMGAGLVHTEMVSALGLCHKGRKTKELLNGSESERPIVLQLFGANSEDILRGAEIALDIRKFDAIEINMACPMPKVTKKGSGSKLLEHPAEAADIIRRLKPLGLPVWSKIRLLSCADIMATVNFCDNLFAAGADYLIVHGRTPLQRYEGAASREAVFSIAEKYPGMIGGSGDCYKASDFKEYLDCGCLSVLAARGILRDIFIVPRTLSLLNGDEFVTPDFETQSGLLRELGQNIYNTEGQSLALMIIRRMLASLFSGFRGAAQLRRRGAMARTWCEMDELLVNWQDIQLMPEVEFSKENFPHGVIGEFQK